METSLVISGISSVATVAAAFIYYRTLKTLKLQTANAYKPHLFLDNSIFHVQGIQRNGITMPIKWSDKVSIIGLTEQFNAHEILRNKFILKCYNIGFGTATKVSVNFSYEIDDFIKEIQVLEKDVPEQFHIAIEYLNPFISFTSKNPESPYLGVGVHKELGFQRYVSYILPANISNSYSEIELPIHFLELLNIYIFYIACLFSIKRIEPNIPVITTEITYLDISNKAVTRNLSISTVLGAFGVVGYHGEFIISEED